MHPLPVYPRQVHCQEVVLREADAGLVARWEELADSAAEPNPFLDPGVLLPAARLLPDGDAARLLVVEDAGRLVLLMPVQRRGGFRRLPLPVLTTWTHDYAFLGTPLVAPGFERRAWAAVLEHLRTTRPAPWAALELLAEDGPVDRGLRDALTARRVRSTSYGRSSRPVVHRRSEPTYLDGRLSPRRRKALRRLRRRLEEEVGGPLVLADGARADLEGGIDEFLRVEASGWKGRDGGALACRPAHAQWFREMCRLQAAAGRLELWRLGPAGGPAVAVACNLRSRDTVFHVKIAFDEQYARFSPGVHLELAMLEAFHADASLQLLDSCTGAGGTVSEQLYPDSRSLRTVLLPLGPPSGRVAARLAPGLASLSHRLPRRRPSADQEARP